ncbi:hypothetical protein EDC94DRAFT_605988 [Helicostylum pulchrum]|nr:hypothetical protein EDC94DRAFT_605988 [Helicostylum pulchrum]
MYTNYVKENFDNILKEVKETLAKEIYSSVDDAVDEEKIKSIVVPLGQALRKDLPLEARRTIIDKFNNTIQQYSDFASLFALHVQLNILKFVISGDITAESTRIQVDSIIPREFRPPPPPTNQANDDVKRKSDYKTLYVELLTSDQYLAVWS